MKKKDYNDIIEDMRKRKVVSIMGRQVVFVGGKRFTIITDESEEYMKNIVERLDTRLRSIISTNPKLDKDSAALLASLDYCDEEYKIKKKLDENKDQMKQYLSEITRLHMEIDSLKREKKEMQMKINKILNVDPDDVVTEKPSEKKIIATGKIEKSVQECIAQAGIKNTDIELVILTGGSTEIPYVSRVMQSYFPNAELSSANKMASVGLGLAYDAMRRFAEPQHTK